VVTTILLVLYLLAMLPGRIRLFSPWQVGIGGIALIIPVAGVGLSRGRTVWLLLERASVLLFVLSAGVATLVNLSNLIRAILSRSAGLSGIELLTSSIAVYATNVLMFSLLFWQMDRGGPEARANAVVSKPDWQFPQTACPEEAADGWRPAFVDYLCLAFTTATAFSPTDVLPLTSRAKMLMMLESSIALVTVVLIASRAINILGS
jgi:hypothetical protein